MYCCMCKRVAVFTCPCKYQVFCEVHLGTHYKKENCGYLHEPLSIKLNILEYQKIKDAALIRIDLLEQSKSKTILLCKKLNKNIEVCCKSATEKLEKNILICLTLMSSESISNSLKKEADKILNTTFSIEPISFDVDQIIEEVSAQDSDLFKLFEEPIKQRREQKIKETQEEKNKLDKLTILAKQKKELEEQEIKEAQEKKIKEDELKQQDELKKQQELKEAQEKKHKDIFFQLNKSLKHLKSQIQKVQDTQGCNTWAISKKKQFLEQLKIADYMDKFEEGGQCFDRIKEIMFSDDGKYTFICIIYIGIFK